MTSLAQRLHDDGFRIDLHGASLPGVSFDRTSLFEANLRNTDFHEADLSGSDFEAADLTGTNLKGANLAGAKNLTVDQLRKAIIDDETVLPEYIDRALLTD